VDELEQVHQFLFLWFWIMGGRDERGEEVEIRRNGKETLDFANLENFGVGFGQKGRELLGVLRVVELVEKSVGNRVEAGQVKFVMVVA
jgi:hypothetical protein